MTSKLYDAFKTDKSAEQSGVWVELSGSSFKLARMGGSNLKFQRALAAATRPMMREIQLGLADEVALEKIMKRVFIDTVLLDWKNVEDPELSSEDTPVYLDFNRDTAAKILDDLPDLYAQLREQAQNYANYRASAIEAISKN